MSSQPHPDQAAAHQLCESHGRRRSRDAELAFLATVARLDDEAAVFQALTDHVVHALGGDAAVFTRSADPAFVDLAAIAAQDPGDLEAARRRFGAGPIRADEGVAASALQGEVTTRPKVADGEHVDGEGAETRATIAGEHDAPVPSNERRALLVIPLSAGEEPIGYLQATRGDNDEPFRRSDLELIQALAASAAFASGAVTARRSLRGEAERQRVLTDLVEALTEERDSQGVLERLSQTASDVLGGSLAIYRLTPDGRELDVVALASHDRVADDFRVMYARQRWRTDEGFMGLALRSGESVFRPYLSSAERDAYLAGLRPDRRREMAARDLRAIIAVPLSQQGRTIGVLSLARYGPAARPLSDRDLLFAEELARRTNMALARLAVAAEREREVERSRLLAEFLAAAVQAIDEKAVLEQLAERSAEAVGASCIIYTASDDGQELETVAVAAGRTGEAGALRHMLDVQRWRRNEGLAGMVLARGETAFRPYLSEQEQAAYLAALPADRRPAMGALDMRAAIAVPLRVEGRTAGVVMLIRFGSGSEPFTDRDAAFAEELASRADVALTRQALLAARERSARTLQAMFDASPLATQLLRPDGTVELWNRAAERLFGFTADEAIGRRPPTIPPEQVDPELDIAARVRRGEMVNAVPARRNRKDGSAVEVELYGAAVPDEQGGTSIVGIYADVTERKRMEREIARTSETLRAILDASPLPIITVDDAMRVTFWNRAAERAYGWSADEVLGSRPPFGPIGDPLLLERSFRRLREGGVMEAETQRRTRSGTTLEVRIHGVPLRDDAGRFLGGLGIHEDITERRRLEAELLQAQKMETVGRLAGGVAHDFNNILTAIIGYADLAQDLTVESEARHALGTIKSSAQRAAALTQQLLAFSRRQMLQPTIVDPNDVVLAMESMLRRLIGENIELVTAVTAGVGAILVDRTQLEQVVLNLAVNARDAMPSGGRLVIRTEAAHVDGDAVHIEMPVGEYAVVSVIDTGTGMDETTKAHIFEPFFTTKELGKGTGLGLSMAYGIVRQSGGYIWVYSEPGRGTTFKLYFPRVGAADAPSAEPAEPPSTRHGRVLLVEDETILRELARRVLSRGGFEVAAAADPAEALAMYGEQGPFDVLVTDIVMPGSTGIDLARDLWEAQPDLRVLFMSGYAEDLGGAERLPRSRFLAKPFTPSTLLRALDEVLAEAAEPQSE